VMEPADVQATFTNITKHKLFQDWKKIHSDSFLSHFFCPLDNACQAKGPWEIGFYDKGKNKITIFVAADNSPEIKQEDDIFKKEEEIVEELPLKEVAVPFTKAAEILRLKSKPELSHQQLGDGFIVLQQISGKTLWNFTFITKTLQFANSKVNASSGELESQQLINVVESSGK